MTRNRKYLLEEEADKRDFLQYTTGEWKQQTRNEGKRAWKH